IKIWLSKRLNWPESATNRPPRRESIPAKMPAARRPWPFSASLCRPLSADRLDGADRIILATDQHLRRVLAEIDAADGALDLGRDRDGLTVGAVGVDRHGVIAVRPSDAVGALAVPGEGLIARAEGHAPRIDGLAAGVGDAELPGRRRRHREAPGRRRTGGVRQHRRIALDRGGDAD